MNSGLTSLGHLLTVTSNTPTICRVDSNTLWDQPGGIKNKTIVSGLANGTCSLTWYFPGTTDRATTSTTWSGLVSIIVPTSTYVELQSLQKVLATSGNKLSLAGLDAGRIAINAFVKTPDPSLMGSGQLALNSTVSAVSVTPNQCSVERVTYSMGTTNPYTGVIVKPLARGICVVRFSYAGESAMKRAASSLDWTASVS
jgi:hypothetical protein